jgi:tRNA (cmo5U34)-methyltransferase
MRLAMPGVDGLDRLVRASLGFLGDQAQILIVGAGGGREIETLAPSPRCYRFTAVDPSRSGSEIGGV